jgi:RNA polymerase sigma-70 factor, ECF subfamily
MMSKVEKGMLTSDRGSFRELVLTFAPKVKAMMLRHGADVETAEDIAQETMLTVWRKAHLFVAEKGSLSTWIFTIARNLRIDRIRRQTVWQAYDDNIYDMPSDDEPAETRLMRQQEEACLLAALASLPPEQREVIHLAYIDGLSHSQIASKLHLPLGTVKSRVRLAYQKLRDEVEGSA